MLKKSFVLALCLAIGGVLLAQAPGAVIVGTSISGNQVSVAIHNPSASPETSRVQVVVNLGGGTTVTLVTGNITLDGGATTTVSLTASCSIVSITEDPQPISPVY